MRVLHLVSGKRRYSCVLDAHAYAHMAVFAQFGYMSTLRVHGGSRVRDSSLAPRYEHVPARSPLAYALFAEQVMPPLLSMSVVSGSIVPIQLATFLTITMSFLFYTISATIFEQFEQYRI